MKKFLVILAGVIIAALTLSLTTSCKKDIDLAKSLIGTTWEAQDGTDSYILTFNSQSGCTMDKIEKDPIPNDDDSLPSDNGFTFHWFKLIIGVVICYFWFAESLASFLPLAIVVLIHESGHVVAGKLFGCFIEEMQVFFLCFVS